VHVPHAQEEVQVCVPPVPQLWLAPDAQTPWPVHELHVPVVQLPVLLSQVTVLVCEPQLPQVWLVAGLDEAGQVWPVHAPQAPQVPPPQFAVQVLVCVPLLPHPWLVGCVWVGLQQEPLHTAPPQLLVLLSVPQPLEQALLPPPP
jgi:hypothetical protein